MIASTIAAASAEDASKDRPQNSAERHTPDRGVLRLLPADSLHGAFDRHAARNTGLYGNRRYACLLRPVRRAKCIGLLHSLCSKNGAKNRPLTFVFNGGPGAASAFLHLGLVGPRVLDFGPDGRDAARASLRDNPDTWLAFTDLVLIDPVGTGWSRAVKSDEARHFWSVSSDADSMAKAVALYVAKNNRGDSPKYLFGESYGGFRAAKTARALQRDQGIVVAGIVMLSPLLEGWLTFGDDSSALRAALQLPSLAAGRVGAHKSVQF